MIYALAILGRCRIKKSEAPVMVYPTGEGTDASWLRGDWARRVMTLEGDDA